MILESSVVVVAMTILLIEETSVAIGSHRDGRNDSSGDDYHGFGNDVRNLKIM